MSFHTEVLTAPQLGVVRLLGPEMAARSFQLAGGTALAIVLGHRRSIDLDWFTRDPFPDPLRTAGQLRAAGVPFATERVEPGTLHGRIEGVRVSLLEYRYPLLERPVEWPEHSCALLSLDDIACMKLSAIAQRGARKDFLDLYALVTEHRPLDQLLALYREKFTVSDIGHVLYGLCYFDDAEAEPMPEMLWTLEWREVKLAVRGWVAEIARPSPACGADRPGA